MNTQEYIEKTQKEINKIESELKNTKSMKIKMSLKRKLLKILVVMRFFYPALIGIVLGATGSYFLGITPFYKDDKKETLRTKKEIDSFNNVCYECQYEDYGKSNKISVIGTWNKLDNGLYERTVETYNLEDINEEEIIKIINGENQVDSIGDLFEEKPTTRREGKNKLSEEDMYDTPYLQATIYSEDKNDIVIVKESWADNLAESTFVTVVILLLGALSVCVREKIKNEDTFSELGIEFDILNQKYTYDEEHLKRILEIKKDNYDTLVRKL